VGVELLEASGHLCWCLDFRDMASPAIVILAANYGSKTAEGGGFVLCPLYGRNSKAFMATSGSTNTTIISHLVHLSTLMFHVLVVPPIPSNSHFSRLMYPSDRRGALAQR
jgi:DnaJ homolog subfamily C member 13